MSEEELAIAFSLAYAVSGREPIDAVLCGETAAALFLERQTEKSEVFPDGSS